MDYQAIEPGLSHTQDGTSNLAKCNQVSVND